MKLNSTRNVVGALAISGAALVGLLTHEGWVDTAAPPVKGDVCTHGFGSTTDANGKPVKCGDKIDPVRGVQRALRDVNRFEGAIKSCVKVPLHQYEYDAFVLLAYNIGEGKDGVKDGFCWVKRGGPSNLVKRLNAGDYAGACLAIKDWVKFKGKVLRGLVIRREAEYKRCMGELE